MQESNKLGDDSFDLTEDTSKSKENPTQTKKKVTERNEKEKKMAAPIVKKEKDPTTKLEEEAAPKTEAVKESTPREEVPGISKPSSSITKGTSKVTETKAAKGETEMETPTDQVRGSGGRFVKKQEEPAPESKEKPVPETEAVKESMPREEVPGIPKPSSTITKGTSKVAETKAAKGKEEDMATPAASYTTYRGSGGTFVKQQEGPTPEPGVKPVPETEEIKESEEKKEMSPPIEKEKKEEPTPELKAEPVLETEDVKESEVKKDIPGIPKPSSPDIEKRAKEAKEEIGKAVKIVKTETGKVFALAKNASDKLIKAIAKPRISDVMKKTVITSMSAIKHPVNAVSNFDKKVTIIVKRLTYFNIRNNSPNSKNNDPNSKNSNKMPVVIVLNADKRITKSVKELFNSII